MSQPNLSSSAQNGSHSPHPHEQQQPNPPKNTREDYVYFDRNPSEFSSDAVAHATAAKLKLESYYKVAVDTAIERNARYVFFPVRVRHVSTCAPFSLSQDG